MLSSLLDGWAQDQQLCFLSVEFSEALCWGCLVTEMILFSNVSSRDIGRSGYFRLSPCLELGSMELFLVAWRHADLTYTGDEECFDVHI